MKDVKNIDAKKIFEGATQQGKEDMETILNMLADSWKDEFTRCQGSSGAKSIEERCMSALADIQLIKDALIPKPVVKKEYSLSNLVEAYKKDQAIGQVKNIQIQFSFNGKEYQISSTSWKRSYTELVKQVFLIDPAFLQVMSLQTTWKIQKTKTDMLSPVELFGGSFIEAHGSFLSLIEKVKKITNNILGLKPSSVKVVIW